MSALGTPRTIRPPWLMSGVGPEAVVDGRVLLGFGLSAITRRRENAAQSLRQPGVPGSALWKVIGPMPQMAMTAGSVPSFLTPS
jgi:hypothetical protein